MLKPLTKPALTTSFKVIFIIVLILFLLLWNVPILTFNSNLWLLFQKRSNIILDLDDVKTYNNMIINFLSSDTKLDFLNERELGHMQDVKTIITTINILLIFSFVTLGFGFYYFLKSGRKFLLKSIKKVSVFIFVLVLVISIFPVTNFSTAFLSFHKIFFVKNFVFPENSILKMLYPDELFFSLSMVYLLSVLLVSFAVIIISHKLKLK